MSCSARNVSLLKYLVFLHLFLSLLLSLVLAVIANFRLHPTKQVVRADLQLCVTCQQIELNPTEDIWIFSNLSIERDGSSVQCCLTKFADIREIVARMVERKRRLKLSEGYVKDLPITCGPDDNNKGNSKLVGILPIAQNKSDQYMVKVQWNMHSSASFTGSALYVNDSLQILESAFYYIYTNLVYRQEWKNNSEEFGTFCSVLYRHIPMTETKYDTILMQSCNSLCKPYSIHSKCVGYSHMESVFFLKNGDEVYIKVSDPERLDENERNNIFGLFRT
ncbi:hypothetical protein CHS0354_009346 [Potamilus streckersoni]|uniref:THD domain-containing protein n=1 Tax=Potamilus streckersoni TaxID=2493646 RepID=A0AAE0TGH3_9BIVA|nr:hypothetical protein CHS0354_009346 [Potamilus streckersoni]